MNKNILLLLTALTTTATMANSAEFLPSTHNWNDGSKAAIHQPTMAEIHLGHVDTGWKDTPKALGLLNTAQSEAKIAAFHASLALKKPNNLKWIKIHSNHVLQALTGKGKGPGAGYGVLKASKGASKHITFAANSAGATAAIKLHATHIKTSADNVTQWSKEMVALIHEINNSTGHYKALKLVKQVSSLAQQLNQGVDSNGDGKITWVKGEGGLKQAAKHMTILRNTLKK